MTVLPFLAASLVHQAIFALIIVFACLLWKSDILSYAIWFLPFAFISAVMSTDFKAIVSGINGVSVRLRVQVRHGSPPPHSTLGSLFSNLSFSSFCKSNSSQGMEPLNMALLKRKPVHLLTPSNMSLTSIPLLPGNSIFPSHLQWVPFQKPSQHIWLESLYISFWRIWHMTAQPLPRLSSVIIPTETKYAPEGHFVSPKMMWDN